MSSSMRSIGICTEPTSARSSTCAPARPRRRASAPRGSALLGSPPPPRIRSRDRLDRAPRDQQRDRRGEAVDLELERHRQRRFADRREHAGVALDVDLAAHQLRAAELVPRRPTADRRSCRACPCVSTQSISVRWRAAGAWAASPPSRHSSACRTIGSSTLISMCRSIGCGLDGHRDRVRRQLRLGGRPRVLADVGQDELDLGAQLARQPAAERLAEQVERAHDPAPELGGELGRLGEVERPHRLGGVARELLVELAARPALRSAPAARARRRRRRRSACRPG